MGSTKDGLVRDAKRRRNATTGGQSRTSLTHCSSMLLGRRHKQVSQRSLGVVVGATEEDW